jgi:pyruvate,water dikinase
MRPYVLPFNALGRGDADVVGGKNSSLGEMLRSLGSLGVDVPDGFATTVHAFRDFLRADGLDGRIAALLRGLDVDDIAALTRTGAEIRRAVLETNLPARLRDEVVGVCRALGAGDGAGVAVRSSATAEDLPEASFAGQQATFLNVRGEAAVVSAVHEVFASLFNDRAIAYRAHNGFDHGLVGLSVGIQRMVRSDLGASGVMFTLDTDSGFRDVVLITSFYGLGETVVQGAVNPDEFFVYKSGLSAGRPAIVRRNLGAKAIKMVYADDDGRGSVVTVDVPLEERQRFSLSDAEVEELARQAMTIESHYGCPMDIEWAKDGTGGRLFIVQARPESVQSRDRRSVARFALKSRSRVLVEGRSIGRKIAAGRARVLAGHGEMARIAIGDVLVADKTDPDWEPVMKRAAAIVTRRGGRTCHAAIIARKLGVPAVVGCGDSLDDVRDGEPVTVSCAEGDTGHVYEGVLPFEEAEVVLDALPTPPVRITMNVGKPDRAFDFAQTPNQGVGLARLEFIVNRLIGIHPRAVLEFDRLEPEVRRTVLQQTAGFPDPVSFYVQKLAEGVSQIAAAFAPAPVIVRLSDFKSNEYANLIGGRAFEPREENPMLGFRGAARYLDPYSGLASSSSAARCASCATTWGSRTCRSWCRSSARRRKRRRSRGCWRRTVCGAAPTVSR